MLRIVLSLGLLLAAPAVAGAGAGNFSLVNGTGGGIAELSISRAGTSDWKSLGNAPAPGASRAVPFNDPDCAFDIRAKSDGKPLTWTGVNLCGAKSVILRTDPSAGAWVDYDQ